MRNPSKQHLPQGLASRRSEAGEINSPPAVPCCRQTFAYTKKQPQRLLSLFPFWRRATALRLPHGTWSDPLTAASFRTWRGSWDSIAQDQSAAVRPKKGILL